MKMMKQTLDSIYNPHWKKTFGLRFNAEMDPTCMQKVKNEIIPTVQWQLQPISLMICSDIQKQTGILLIPY